VLVCAGCAAAETNRLWRWLHQRQTDKRNNKWRPRIGEKVDDGLHLINTLILAAVAKPLH
jgi:hypothetical protein